MSLFPVKFLKFKMPEGLKFISRYPVQFSYLHKNCKDPTLSGPNCSPLPILYLRFFFRSYFGLHGCFSPVCCPPPRLGLGVGLTNPVLAIASYFTVYGDNENLGV